jgi:hypothetical protein
MTEIDRFRHIAVAVTIFAISALPMTGCAGVAAADEPPSIFAVGDLHGDYDAFVAILNDADLIDARGRWSGGDAVLVQTGDIADRGPASRKIIEHLQRMEKQARRKGGDVIVLIGNHEAMNITGDLRYVSEGEYSAFVTRESDRFRERFFSDRFEELATRYRRDNPAIDDDTVLRRLREDFPLGWVEHRQAWSVQGKIGAWFLEKDAVARLGDNLFVHGGISAPYAAKSLDQINAEVRGDILDTDLVGAAEDEIGPLWHRGNAVETPEGAADIADALEAFGVKRLVIGHTPSLEGVRTLYDDRVYVIDTGISAAYGGVRDYIEIREDAVVVRRAGDE